MGYFVQRLWEFEQLQMNLVISFRCVGLDLHTP